MTSRSLTPPDSPSLHPLTFWLLAAIFVIISLVTEHSWTTSVADSFSLTADQMEAQTAGGDTLRRIAFLSMAGIGLWGLIVGRREFHPVSALGAAMAAFVLWSAASVTWSIEPSMTIRRVVVLVCYFLGAAGLSRLMSLRELTRLALVSSVVFLMAGVAAELAQGSFRPWAGDYRFSGTQHPNTQGMNLAMLCLSSFCLARDRRKGSAWLFVVFAIGFVFLLLTKSRTSCAAVIVALWPLWLLKYRPQVAAVLGTAGSWACGAGVLALMLVGIDVVHQGTDMALLGREEQAGSLTGRIPIWTELAPYLADRPIIGYGYASFWTADRIEEITNTLQWPIREAHSSYLDTILAVGLIGAAIMAVIVVLALWKCAARYIETRAGSYGFLFGLTIYCLINAFSESAMTMLMYVGFIATAGFAHLAFCRVNREATLATSGTTSGSTSPTFRDTRHPIPAGTAACEAALPWGRFLTETRTS